MGLDIYSASDKSYHYGYSGIHQVRYMGYRSIGGVGDFGTFMEFQRQPEITGKLEEAMERFPNLFWHSDCDGEYTIDGEVKPWDKPGRLETGNSKGLLEELQHIKDNLPAKNDKQVSEMSWSIFNSLYELTKDVVENHDGRLEFS